MKKDKPVSHPVDPPERYSVKKILIIGALPRSLINFRGDLINALVGAGHQVTAMAAEVDPEVTAALASMGVGFHPYPVQRNSMNPLQDIQTLFALRKAIGKIKPHIVLAYTIKPVIWGGLALYGQPGVRFYALITGLGFAFQQGSPARRVLAAMVSTLYRLALSRATRVIFQNPDNRDLFVSRRIVEHCRCALVNGSGVDLQRFPHTPLPVDGVVFLTIGRLLKEKGFREYAQAAAMVRTSYPHARFLVLGPEDPSPDGIPLEEVRQWDAVEYLGETRDVRPYLADCHVYVLASYHEGMPRTVLEAMALGRPILTTDVPGCRETVVPGVNGFLVPKGNSRALAERMIWFIEHPQAWQSMGRHSRDMAEQRFDVHEVNGALLEIMGLSSQSPQASESTTTHHIEEPC